MTYVDKNGVQIRDGDIMQYDERPGDKDVGRGIHVAEIGETQCARAVVGYPAWTKIDCDPIDLRYYTSLGWTNSHDNICTACTVVGNIKDNPEMIEPEYACNIWPPAEEA